MSIESMRVGGGRCPPLLVGVLLVICLMLVVNWYSLSSENLELLRQLDELGEQLKISAEERDQCMTLRAHLEQRYKKSDEEVASLHVRIAQQMELKRQKNEEQEMSLTACKTELTSLKSVYKTRLVTIEALHLEKERTSTQLNETRDENKKLREELEKIKNELEAAKTVINAPAEKKGIEVAPKENLQDPLNNGQLAPVPESAVKVSQQGLQAQANAKIRNNVDNGGAQDSQDEEEEMKKQINMIAGNNPFDETDDLAELNNVADEEKEQKLVTNEQEKQKNLIL